MESQRLIVVDDETDFGSFVANVAESVGFECHVCSGVREYRKVAVDFIPDVIVSDIFMPEIDGIEFLKEIARDYPNVKLFLMSGNRNKTFMNYARTIGEMNGLNILSEINKPIRATELAAILRHGLA